MEPLGKKLQQARLARKISLEEASRVTKIRAARIQDIENENFSNFSSLAYAKGFLIIYGKYLDVDVTPYLDAFETSREVSVDGYAYLQDTPAAAPPPIVRRRSEKRPTLLPLIIAVGVLVLGLYLVKLLLDIQRIAPSSRPQSAVASATPSPTVPPAVSPSEKIVAPRALPVEESPASEAQVGQTPVPIATPLPATAATTEPEVRRAQPVHPEDLAVPNAPTPPLANRIQITPVRKTYLRVIADDQSEPIFNGWLDTSDPPLVFRARHATITVLERTAVQITKNNAALAADDKDVTFQ